MEGANAGVFDLFVIKYDSNGNLHWTRQLGTASTDSGWGIATDNSRNIYVCGSTTGIMGDTQYGQNDLYLVKYNSRGVLLWTRQMGSNQHDVVKSGCRVAADNSGNVYITSATLGSIDGQTNAGSGDMYLMKYDSGGNYKWTRQVGGIEGDFGENIAVDASGNIYVTGESYSNPYDGQSNAGYNDMFLSRYDSSGNRQWTRMLGGTGEDFGQGVAVDTNGNIYVAGTTSSPAFDGIPIIGDECDAFLVKYDSSGNRK
jgi:hypothetical protein